MEGESKFKCIMKVYYPIKTEAHSFHSFVVVVLLVLCLQMQTLAFTSLFDSKTFLLIGGGAGARCCFSQFSLAIFFFVHSFLFSILFRLSYFVFLVVC